MRTDKTYREKKIKHPFQILNHQINGWDKLDETKPIRNSPETG